MNIFNWLRRTGRKKSGLEDWKIDEIDGFKKIYNEDSIQFVNEDAGKVIYFSILTVSGGNLLDISNDREPTLTEEANGWQLKGFKKNKNKILVCVITLKDDTDIEWASAFFTSIRPCENHE